MCREAMCRAVRGRLDLGARNCERGMGVERDPAFSWGAFFVF